MPPQKAQSGLMKKYGAKLSTAVQQHASDETDFGIINLPYGISNGIAQIVECKFDTYKTGRYKDEYYFRAAGVVISPKSVAVDGISMPVAGLQTSYMEEVCDTATKAGKQTPQAEHISNILNEMRKLGLDTTGKTGEDLEDLAAAIKEMKPFFRFSTSPRYPQGADGKPDTTQKPTGAWENWNGGKGLEEFDPSSLPDDGGVQDGSGDNPPDPDASAAGADAGSNEAPSELPTDLAELAAFANETASEEAIIALTQMGLDAGMTDDEIQAVPTWADFPDIYLAKVAENEAAAAADEPQPDPKKGELYKYQVIGADGKIVRNPKTKKEADPVECEVTLVNVAKKTVTLKNNTDKKTIYKDVPFSSLMRE